jgi:hypothetical protein
MILDRTISLSNLVDRVASERYTNEKTPDPNLDRELNGLNL